LKGDFTRNTFKKDKHYTSVRMQQGRVQLDAEWNEQVDITNNRIDTQGIDTIGPSGVPKSNPGFEIKIEGNDILIGYGKIYVDGIHCENDNDQQYPDGLPYIDQPDFRDVTLPTEPSYYLAYLDVWHRHISAVEEPSLQEEALGKVDTTTRSKTVWQVKLLKLTETPSPGQNDLCDLEFSAWSDLIANRQARLAAQTESVSSLSTDQCSVASQSSSQIMSNQLYRVEIHTAGPVGTAHFKWSRDNGSVVAAIDSFNETENSIGISEPSRDDVQRFEPEQWVELIDEILELKDGVGIMVKLTAPTIGTTLNYDPATATGSIPYSRWKTKKDQEEYKPRVRRWDHRGAAAITTFSDWIDLEDGIQVQFGENGKDNYQIGDYWLIPARAISRNVEWPLHEVTRLPKLQERIGINHHYCRLALLLKADDNWERIEDCRKFFPSLTTICAEDVCVKPNYCENVLQKEPPLPWSEIRNAQQAFDKICYNLYKCNKFLSYLRGDGILRDEDGKLGFELSLGTGTNWEIDYEPGIAFVNGCRFEIENGGTITLDKSMTHQLLVVDDKGEVTPITKDPLTTRYAPIAIISTYQNEIKRILDVRFDLTNLDKKAEQNFQHITKARSDRRQFVPLLAHSIKGLQYRNGRNVKFDLSKTEPEFKGAPSALSSDGENIWIANSSESAIARIPREAIDPGEIEVIELGMSDPQNWATVYDGCCLWFTFPDRNSVMFLNPNILDPNTRNYITHEIEVGLNPHGIAYDGDFVWICNYGSNSISIIDVDTCQMVRAFLLINPDTGQAAHPDSIAFDGTHVWVAAAPNMLFKIEKPWGDPEMVTDKLTYEQGGLAFDGSHIWISSQHDQLIKFEIDVEIDRTKNNIERLFDNVTSTHAITFDGTYIWAFQQVTSEGVTNFIIHKIDPAVNEIIGHINIDPNLEAIYNAIFDGTHLWISTDKSILKKLV